MTKVITSFGDCDYVSETFKKFYPVVFNCPYMGVAFVAQSVAMDYIGPYTFNAVRSLLGGIVLVPCVFFFGRKKKTGKNPAGTTAYDHPRDMVIGGLLCGIMLFLSTTLQQVGIQYTTVAKAGFITRLYIILVPILGIFLKKGYPFKSGSAWS